MSLQRFYAHGKLMLTGEYAVLDGAKSLAIPTKFGQKMEVMSHEASHLSIHWKSYNYQNELWMDFQFPNNAEISDLEKPLHLLLQQIVPNLPIAAYEVNIYLEFPNNWGLGSSSTLVSLLAQWSNANPYVLLGNSFGGSGYDIACATSYKPIVYRKIGGEVNVQMISSLGSWTSNAYFIFLEQKQNSREAIQHYKSLQNTKEVVAQINEITDALVSCTELSKAQALFFKHEELMSSVLKLPQVKETKFPDFNGVCKSLGAWGGDFIMALSEDDELIIKDYFNKKGYTSIFAFKDMIWN